MLDNECSKAVQTFIKSNGTDIQIVEPHNHSVNAAEPSVKAIQYHIIAGLATVDIIAHCNFGTYFLHKCKTL